METKIITYTGETWDQIAQRVYGNSKLVKPLFEANPQHAAVWSFRSGVQLTAPQVPFSESNIANAPPWRRNQ